ncbi:MAG TPA: BON domain-containing protein [Planctomycetaceae bacterium]|nr:BON domain-containing protein [Planctomycetaceae bacterium]
MTQMDLARTTEHSPRFRIGTIALLIASAVIVVGLRERSRNGDAGSDASKKVVALGATQAAGSEAASSSVTEPISLAYDPRDAIAVAVSEDGAPPLAPPPLSAPASAPAPAPIPALAAVERVDPSPDASPPVALESLPVSELEPPPPIQFEPGSRAASVNQKLAEAVAKALKEANLTGYDIDISVQRGVVTLQGRVADAEARKAAEKTAAGVSGITTVVNRLASATRIELEVRSIGDDDLPIDAKDLIRGFEKKVEEIEDEAAVKIRERKAELVEALKKLRESRTAAKEYDQALAVHQRIRELKIERVKVEWQGTWYPAKILETNESEFLIRYDGYDNSWDEWITRDRIRFRTGRFDRE